MSETISARELWYKAGKCYLSECAGAPLPVESLKHWQEVAYADTPNLTALGLI